MSALPEAPITLVAAVRVDPDRPVSDLDRFVALALPSFRDRLPADLVRELVVIVPPRDVAEVTRRLLAASPLPVRVIDERELVGELGRAGGWVRQQIIKLAAPAVVRTPWYLTLDADVLATRRVDRDFLLPGGRAIWEREPAGAHWPWWQDSARLLDVPVPLQPDAAAFGATPAILHTEAVRALQQAIEAAHPGASWIETLVARHDAGWTEYTLYWTHLLATGRAAELYADGPRVPYALDASVWTPEDLAARRELEFGAVFDPAADHAFFVFQSNLERPLDEIVRSLRPHLEPGSAVTAAERRRWARHARAYRLRRLRRGLKRRVLAAVRRARAGGRRAA